MDMFVEAEEVGRRDWNVVEMVVGGAKYIIGIEQYRSSLIPESQRSRDADPCKFAYVASETSLRVSPAVCVMSTFLLGLSDITCVSALDAIVRLPLKIQNIQQRRSSRPAVSRSIRRFERNERCSDSEQSIEMAQLPNLRCEFNS